MKSLGPPNSPPTAGDRLANRMAMARPASIQNTVTEKPKLKHVSLLDIDIFIYNASNSMKAARSEYIFIVGLM